MIHVRVLRASILLGTLTAFSALPVRGQADKSAAPPRDQERAFRWWLRAGEQGQPTAQFNVAASFRQTVWLETALFHTLPVGGGVEKPPCRGAAIANQTGDSTCGLDFLRFPMPGDSS